MPRKRIPHRKLTLKLDPALVARVELLNWNPTFNRPRYGSWNQLVNALLREYLSRHPADPSLPPLSNSELPHGCH